MTAAIDGSEEVWSAILASTLTHIAVFVPMLFLTGVASITFGSLAAVVSFSLAMSLFVAVTIVPVLCSRFLDPPHINGETRRACSASLYRFSERAAERYRQRLRPAPPRRARTSSDGVRHRHRPLRRWRSTSAGSSASSCSRPPTRVRSPSTRSWRSARASKSPKPCCSDSRKRSRRSVPEVTMLITSAGGGGGGGGGGFGGGSGHRGNVNVRLTPKDERQRTSEQIAMTLRRELSGLPGVIVRARPSGGQQMRGMPGGNQGGDGSRFSVEIRGHELDVSKRARPGRQDAARLDARHRRLARRTRRGPSGNRGPRRSRQGRPARPVSVTGVAEHDSHQPGRHAGGDVPRSRQRVPDRRPAAPGRPRRDRLGRRRAALSTPEGLVLPAKNVMVTAREQGPVQIERKNQERIQRVNAEVETTLERERRGGPGAAARDSGAAGLLGRLRQRSRGTGQVVPRAAAGARARHPAGLHGHGVAVRVAARSVHHHVLDSAGRHRRGRRTAPDQDAVQHAGLHRHHHAGRHRRQQRHPAGRLRQHAAASRQDGDPRRRSSSPDVTVCGRF